MRILFVSSEVYPFSKTGGLADVAGALPIALARQGHNVLVVSPWYKTLKATPQPLWIGDVSVPFDGGFSDCGVGTLERDGVRYAFVGHSDYQRDELYGYSDDAYRFARFTRAVAQVAERLDFRPDIVHANDWHVGHLPMVLAHGWHLPEGFPGLPSVFTVHNVQHQGASDLGATLYWLRLPSDLSDSFANHFGRANAMQSALGFAHHVTTVSPTYAEEIKQPEYGYGLDGTFRHIDGKLTGILNGLDVDVWDPRTDPHLVQPYDAETFFVKWLTKSQLCERFGLEPSLPLMGSVSRLADQKGIDLVLYALNALLGQGWNLLVLGSGDKQMEATLRGATDAHPGRVGSFIGYNEDLAHQVYAGCDALIVPSRFEPCGLSQMIAMRYGTLPVARATGGLRDTIDHGRTGFLFDHISSDGVLWASSQARETYRDAENWQQMMHAAMAEDFSWDSSAQAYAALYERLV